MRRLLLLCLLISFCACTHTRKDDRWVYDGAHTESSAQILRIESVPPASLWLDGKYAGRTPLDISLEHSKKQIRLIKRLYKTLPGGKKEIIDQEEKTEDVSTPQSHTLLLKASGYHDTYMPITAPYSDETLLIRMLPKSSVSNPITCEFSVHADKKDLPLIRSIFSQHDLVPGEQKHLSSESTAATDMIRQTFRITVKDADALADLMGRLHAESRKRQFIFNVRNASAEADFSVNPAREFRAVWISYLDWPKKERDPARQKKMLTKMLDEFKRLNFNTLFFQVRPACDALYSSELAPWSALLTGKQGQNPGYDPLAFIIKEAHSRGLALHAWLNPFRADISGNCSAAQSGFAAGHALNIHPDWGLRFRLPNGRCFTMLNPGIPAVREHIADIAEEIVSRYDVDGIHFDDFFYPYPQSGFKGITAEDRDTFKKYGKGGISLKNWRRSNINRLISRVNQRIKKAKKDVCFGISPFGIWKNHHPPEVTGMGSYHAIYADSLAWLKNKSVDYLTPQLYWKIDGSPDYKKLLEWWAEQVREARGHIYPGQIVFYVGKNSADTPPNKPASATEIADQLFLNRDYREEQVLGSALFRATNGQADILGDDSLKAKLTQGLFATPALPPVFPWLDVEKPSPPQKTAINTNENGSHLLTWEKPSSGIPPKKYAVYAVYREDMIDNSRPIEALGHLVAVTGDTELKIDDAVQIGEGDMLFVTALSRNNAESPPGEAAVFDSVRNSS